MGVKFHTWLKEQTEYLSVLTDYSTYAPNLPKDIRVPLDYGEGKQFMLDGLILDSVSDMNFPTIQFKDVNGDDALRLEIDPSFSVLVIESDLYVMTIYFLKQNMHYLVSIFR